MKKSKVIIPAMALLLFSTAASVTGTVAWFTSTRVFTSNVASFGINAVEDNLEATVAPRVGTALSGSTIVAGSTNTGSTNPAAVPNRLYHGSFNTLSGTGAENASLNNATNAWILNPDRDGSTNNFTPCGTEDTAYSAYHGTGETSLDADNGWLVRKNAKTKENNEDKTYNYYVAFSWSVTFNYTFGGTASDNVAIFLDTNLSNIALDGENSTIRESLSGGTNKNTSAGFRIALYTAASPSTGRIFANNDTKTYIDAPNKPVSDNPNDYSQYGSGVFNKHTTNAGRKAENLTSTNAQALPEYVCSIAKTAQTNAGSTTIICVAWFEGTDTNVVTEARMQTVKASLTFYARNLANS
jgi:hypothetical protein